jgi:polyprenyl P-hydroxybenzoate/phenylacrylic acid decarboxylase-like protein
MRSVAIDASGARKRTFDRFRRRGVDAAALTFRCIVTSGAARVKPCPSCCCAATRRRAYGPEIARATRPDQTYRRAMVVTGSLERRRPDRRVSGERTTVHPSRRGAREATAHGRSARPARIVVAVTGDHRVGLGVRLLELLLPSGTESHLVLCGSAEAAIPAETGRSVDAVSSMADKSYTLWNQAARISSGSFITDGMVLAPCSERSLELIALGYASTLVHRAADVTMKEGRPLALLVDREVLVRADPEHLERLRSVPGVTILSMPPDEDVAAVDATLVRVIRSFGIDPSPDRAPAHR